MICEDMGRLGKINNKLHKHTIIDKQQQKKTARPFHADFSRLFYQLFSISLLFLRYEKVSIREIELGWNIILVIV